jgi:SAM-dependent methyltransferase
MSKEFWERRAKLRGILAVQPTATEKDRRREERFRRRLLDWTVALIKRHTRLPVRQAVDLGCGVGDVAVALAPRAERVFALDYAATMVERARETVATSGWTNISVRQGDLRNFDAFPPRIDLVYLGAVAMYLDDAQYVRLLERLHRQIRPDALIVQRDFVAMNGGETGPRGSGDYTSFRRTVEQYATLAREAGFVTVASHYSSDMEVDRIFRGTVVGRPVKAIVRWILRGKRAGSVTLLLRRASPPSEAGRSPSTTARSA